MVDWKDRCQSRSYWKWIGCYPTFFSFVKNQQVQMKPITGPACRPPDLRMWSLSQSKFKRLPPGGQSLYTRTLTDNRTMKVMKRENSTAQFKSTLNPLKFLWAANNFDWKSTLWLLRNHLKSIYESFNRTTLEARGCSLKKILLHPNKKSEKIQKKSKDCFRGFKIRTPYLGVNNPSFGGLFLPNEHTSPPDVSWISIGYYFIQSLDSN